MEQVVNPVVNAAASRWVSQLIDLTGNNKLLFFKPTAGTVILDPKAMPKALSSSSARLGDLTEPITFDVSRSAYTKSIAKARENYEERGLDTLHLAAGMATWKIDEHRSKPASPVILRPLGAKLEAKSNPVLQFDDGWILNPTLIHFLQVRYGVEIESAKLEAAFLDEDDINRERVEQIFAELIKQVNSQNPDAGFVINPSLLIGNFSYSKLPMVLDLQDASHEGELTQNALLSALAGDADAQKQLRERQPDIDDAEPDKTAPDDEYLILTADSSQSAVINAVVAGADLAIEGPPGTGKSQTIANLIAALSARGKRVLFVAEKRAAIDAVVRNLQTTGLEQLVMDLHSTTNARSLVAKNFSRSLAALQNALPFEDPTSPLLTRERDRLAKFRNSVTITRQPWNTSFDVALQKSLQTDPKFRLDVAQSVTAATTSSIEQLEDLIDRANEFAELNGAAVLSQTAPWELTFSNNRATEPEQAQQLIDTTAKLFDALNAVISRVEHACDDLGFSYPETLGELTDTARLINDLSALAARASGPIDENELASLAEALDAAEHNPLARLVAFVGHSAYRDAKHRAATLLGCSETGHSAYKAIKAAQKLLSERAEIAVEFKPFADFSAESLNLALKTLNQALDAFGDLSAIRFSQETTLSALQDQIESLYNARDLIRQFPRLHELFQTVTDAGLTPHILATVRRDFTASQTRAAISHAVFTSVCNAMLNADTELGQPAGDAHRQAVAQFAELDEKHIASNPARILRLVAEHAVDMRNQYEAENLVIEKQARLQRRHMPVRDLLEKAPNVATALRPCWAMSPLVVSQILPRKQLFDVVIFDEASQVTPADAVGSFLRAKQAVVAGDRHQLPPTSFWKTQNDDEFSEGESVEEEPEAESILDAVSALMPDLRGRRMLTWHYRSRDERLIAFSNAQPSLYDWTLNTFSDARNENCLEHVVVGQDEIGPYKDGSNPGEVARVVTLVRKHIIENPDETLGVITMGARHKNAILDALNEVSEHDPVLRAFMLGGTPNNDNMEPFFVKNLETVQGDQRDAIIISIGYAARNRNGSLNHTFGPINTAGGERRLNVAVTRAKNRVTLVTAFDSSEVRETDDQPEGVKLLARYVKYAASCGNDLGQQHRSYPPLNPFEIDVKQKLEAAGIPLIPQHGVSGYRIDFAALDPDDPSRFVLAIEADGASYHARPTVRDRDRLRQAQLERLGWRFCRIWSTDWFKDSKAEVERVVNEWKNAVSGAAPEPIIDLTGHEPVVVLNGTKPKRGTRPELPNEQVLSAYSDTELYALADWIQSDDVVRTDDEIIDVMFEEMGFERRTASAREKLRKLISN